MNKSICIDCGVEYEKQGKNQKRCGSATRLTGCSGKRKIYLRTHYKNGDKRSLFQRPSKSGLGWLRKQLPNNGFCAECGTTENLSVDHIIPQCIGGSNELSNLRVLCVSCNTKNFHALCKKALRYYFYGIKE